MKTIKISNLIVFLFGLVTLFPYYSCRKEKYPSIVKIRLTDTLTGLPISNMKLKYIQTKNPFLTDKETYKSNGWFTIRQPKYYDGEVITDGNGYCEFKLERAKMDYVSIQLFRAEMFSQTMDYFPKIVKLQEVSSKNAKQHIYKVKMFPVLRNLAYKVIIDFGNIPDWTFNPDDSVEVKNYSVSNLFGDFGDYPYETGENLNFTLNIKRNKQKSDSSEVFYAPNENFKQSRKIRMYYKGIIGNRKLSQCGYASKEFTLEANKLNRIELKFE